MGESFQKNSRLFLLHHDQWWEDREGEMEVDPPWPPIEWRSGPGPPQAEKASSAFIPGMCGRKPTSCGAHRFWQMSSVSPHRD